MEFFVEEDNIWTAAGDGNLTQVQKLIQQNGIDPNEQDEYGYSALHAAASYGHLHVVEYLLSIGSNHMIRDEDGDTPLLVCEQSNVFERLIQAGADPNVKNNHNQGIVDKAVENDAEELVNYLMEKGYITDPNFRYIPGIIEDDIIDQQEIENEDDDEEEEEENEEEDDDDIIADDNLPDQ